MLRRPALWHASASFPTTSVGLADIDPGEARTFLRRRREPPDSNPASRCAARGTAPNTRPARSRCRSCVWRRAAGGDLTGSPQLAAHAPDRAPGLVYVIPLAQEVAGRIEEGRPHHRMLPTVTSTRYTELFPIPWRFQTASRGCVFPLASLAREQRTCVPGSASQVVAHRCQTWGAGALQSWASRHVRPPSEENSTAVTGATPDQALPTISCLPSAA